MLKKGKARAISCFMTALLLITSLNFGSRIKVEAANPVLTVDFNNENGDMKPKTGELLIPSKEIPDGRVSPLKIPVMRDDIQPPWFSIPRARQDSLYRNEQLTQMKNINTRATDFGAKHYAILRTGAPGGSWLQANNGYWEDPFTDLPKWKQLVKDNVQYAKDNSLNINYWDVWNEYWNLPADTRANYNTLYINAWNAIKEVDPNAMIGGPSTNGSMVGDVKTLGDYCLNNGLTVNIAAVHEFGDPANIKLDADAIRAYAKSNPSLGIKEFWTEEYQSGGKSASAGDLTKWFAAIEYGKVDMAMKSIWTFADGLDDMLVTRYYNNGSINNSSENPAQRRTTWWAMKAYAEMSGRSITVPYASGVTYQALASKDITAGEAKVLIGNEGSAATIDLALNNQPFAGSNIRIDKYRVVNSEDNGLVVQTSETPSSTTNLSTSISMSADDVWLIVIKKNNSAPGSFCLKSPDDGVIASSLPTLTWQPASGASSYTVKVSTNKDLSIPVVNLSGITGTSYTLTTALNIDQQYYWSVTSNNTYGSSSAANNMIYTFIVGSNVNVPGRFGPIWPADNTDGQPLQPQFMWYHSYNASTYTVVVDDNSDFSSPEINQSGITSDSVQGVVFTPSTALAPDTTYYWKVYAINSNGSRPMNGSAFSFKTKPAGNNPGSFSLQSPSSGTTNASRRLNVKWSKSNGAVYYKLEAATDSGFSNIVVTRDNIKATSYTFEPDLLSANTTYYWRVTAFTEDKAYSTAASNNGFSYTTEVVPCSPLLKTVYSANGCAGVYFSTVSDAASYKVKYGTSPGNYTTTVTGVTKSPYLVSGLTNGTTYYFAVVAVNANGDSRVYNEVSMTPSVQSYDTDSIIEAEYVTRSGCNATNNLTGYSGGGFVANLLPVGSLVSFNINVPLAGNYNVDMRYGNGQTGARTISIYVNGTKIKQSSFSATGGWNNWSDKVDTLPLNAGINTIMYKVDSGDTAGFNPDYFKVSDANKYEAESATFTGGAKVNGNHSGYSGTGFVDGYYNNTTARTTFNVSVQAAGEYTLKLRYSAGLGTSTNVGLYVNGIKIKNITCNGTASWDTWMDQLETVTLNSGNNTFSYKADNASTACINLDYIYIN